MPRILPRLEDEDATVRRSALVAVRSSRAEAAYAGALGRLSDADAAVRLEALLAVRDFGRPESTPAIAALLKDRETQIRDAALVALRALGAAERGGEIAACLTDGEIQIQVRAAEVLAGLGSRDQRAALREALTQGHSATRRAALLALMWLGEDVSEAKGLLEDADKSVRAAAACCLARSGASEGPAALREILDQPPFDAATRRVLEEGFLARLDPEFLKRPVPAGVRVVSDWLGAVGIEAELEPDSLKIAVENPYRDMRSLLIELCARTEGAVVRVEGRLRLVPLERAVELELSGR
jgi:HEAT repeat protein